MFEAVLPPKLAIFARIHILVDGGGPGLDHAGRGIEHLDIHLRGIHRGGRGRCIRLGGLCRPRILAAGIQRHQALGQPRAQGPQAAVLDGRFPDAIESCSDWLPLRCGYWVVSRPDSSSLGAIGCRLLEMAEDSCSAASWHRVPESSPMTGAATPGSPSMAMTRWTSRH